MGLIDRVLDEARNRLLDTGTRNRLIHVNRKDARSKTLNIINELSDEIFRQLCIDGRRMRFKAMGRDKDEIEDEEDALFALEDLSASDVSLDRQTDNFLETPLGSKSLQKRLLRMASDSRIAEEETGLNILYLALGFLRWKEDKASSVEREAPLILLPVELVRNERTSTYDIKFRGDEISTNLPLAARMQQDFGIILPEVPESEDWLPSEYFHRVEETIAGQPNWSLDRDGMQLGFFSFAKLLMHRDLAPENWPQGDLIEGELISGLLGEGFEEHEPIFGSDTKLDALLDPAEIVQVVDADASQTKVIEEVRRGASLVVQGPPGTGKSQTITNLIAAAVHDGKTVLFVAEKMAALSVVHDRLVKTGLRDICVELHSRSSNKKQFSEELRRTLSASLTELASFESAEKLRFSRDKLNKIAQLLHEPLGPNRLSPFEALSQISRYIGQEETPPRIPLEGLGALTRSAREACVDAITRFAEACEIVGKPELHPFFGVLSQNLQPTDLERARPELASTAQEIEALLTGYVAEAAALVQTEPQDTFSGIQKMVDALSLIMNAPEGLADTIEVLLPLIEDKRVMDALVCAAECSQAITQESANFSDLAWVIDAMSVRSAILRGQTSFFARLGGAYRRSSAELASVFRLPLPPKAEDRRALVDRIIEIQRKQKLLAEDEPYLKQSLQGLWRGERTEFSLLINHLSWLKENAALSVLQSARVWQSALVNRPSVETIAPKLGSVISGVREKVEAIIKRFDLDLVAIFGCEDISDVSLSKLKTKARTLETSVERYSEWSDYQYRKSKAVALGGGHIVEHVLAGKLQPERAAIEFSYACAEAAWIEARRARPELNSLNNENRHQLVQNFMSLEKRRFEEMRDQVLARHYAQMPKGSMGEMGIIKGEFSRRRGHKSIRSLMKSAGRMVQRIKPVFLMSPLSVAQFLPPGAVTFDLLVIDEASQIKPEDAFGVVARAKQIVVVGDQKQLPPTSFFDRMANSNDGDDDDDAPVAATAADMESILTLCEARGLRSRMLEWHYRSRDPSLIRVSNAEFYESNLVLPPSPLELDDDYGLKFSFVAGAYSSKSKGQGRAGTNKIEAVAVVKAVAEHARKWPSLSLGVVTFSKSQSDMMNEILEHSRRSDPILDEFLREGQTEDFFVKNIENVQGDERDVILISVGYGPTEPNGRLASMNFGPVNGDGGERRLNVLFSRARIRCEVFASFQPGDMDLQRTSNEGPRVLKRFLEFAKSGQLEQPNVTGLAADSPFEEDVARVIHRLGYECDLQVGSSGFRIDIAVRHPNRPGQYLLAVECDGATYHSALWARERDRLRQEVLEGLGWRFHRIWSTDWFHRRAQEISRLEAALTESVKQLDQATHVKGANSERRILEDQPVEVPEQSELVELEIKVPEYRKAELVVSTALEPHLVNLSQLAELARRVIEVEGPIHSEEVARRIAGAFGKQRVGARISEVVEKALKKVARDSASSVVAESEFWMTKEQQANPPVRNRSQESGTLLKAKALPPIEIKAAGALVAAECGHLELDEQIKAVCKVFGYQRVGPDLRASVEEALLK